MANNRKRILAPIQALRALAAWMVVYHHYLQIFYGFRYSTKIGHFFKGYGGFGVDIFFVISGFVMFVSLDKRARSAGAFWSERLTRIVPNYWFHTLVLLVIWPLQNLPHWRSVWSPTSLLASLCFVPAEDPSGKMFPFLRVGWTLNYEMFFYAFLALCVLVAKNRAALLAAALLILVPSVWNPEWPGSYILSSWKLAEFSVGICIGAVVSRGLGPLANRTLLGLLVIGLAFG